MARNYMVKPRMWDPCSPWSVVFDDYEIAACHTKEDAKLIAQALNGLQTIIAVDQQTGGRQAATPTSTDAKTVTVSTTVPEGPVPA